MKIIIKSILVFIFLFLNIITHGQNKTPFLQNIYSLIRTDSDTIKVQRYNGKEYHKLVDIVPKLYGVNNYTVLDAVNSIQAYLEARSEYTIADNSVELQRRFDNLLRLGKIYKIYFNLDNYQKEATYYNAQEDKKILLLNEKNDRIKKNEVLRRNKIYEQIAEQRKLDSVTLVTITQKAKADSIHYQNQKNINKILEREQVKKNAKNQIIANSQKKKIQAEKAISINKNKLERRKIIISLYGETDGELILSGKVKIGWTKAKCMASWGKPWTVNRTTTAYGNHEQYVYSLKRYLYFENGTLTAIQD